MATIESSLAELAGLINKFLRFSKRVLDAPQEVESLLDDVSHYGSSLDFLQEVLDSFAQTFNFKPDAIDKAILKFRKTLTELEKFIAKYAPLMDADAGKIETAQHMVGWAIDGEYNHTVKRLKDDIAKYGERIMGLLQPLVMHSDTVIYKAVIEGQIGVQNGVLPAGGDIKWGNPFQRSKSIAPSIAPSISTTIRQPPSSARPSISGTTIAGTIKPDPASIIAIRPSFTPKMGVKILCKHEQPRVISKIRFLGDGDGRLLQLQLVDDSGAKISHPMSKNPIPYLEHPHKTHHIRESYPGITITNLVKFPKVVDAVNYEYIFESKADCEVFQEKVMGKKLVRCANINSILSDRSSKTVECYWQTLRVWRDRTSRAETIMFYSATNENAFLQFDTTHLRSSEPKEDVLKLEFDGRAKGKKRTEEEELEKSLGCLKITFTDPK
ncbi:hypothetical protein GP486_007027, partial [Trichoglossum hirsutum]